MCTVSYLPKAKGGFFFTSNRDEAPHRAAPGLRFNTFGETRLLYPEDIKGGTWISVDTRGRLVCILNGAFVKHKHRPPYRRSRGLMALDFFSFPTTKAFFRTYTLEGMEPFTMIIFDGTDLWELRWDGQVEFVQALDIKEAYIWSSATLYPPHIQEKRLQWFNHFLAQQASFPAQAEILNLHLLGGDGDPENDYVMNRNNIVRTISISAIDYGSDQVVFDYLDLLKGRISRERLGVQGTTNA